MTDILLVNNKEYKIVKLLGHGKGGYSYLATDSDNNYVCLKKIHHEPCSYYSFSNKIESEINDYNKLLATGILMPRFIDVDKKQEIIIKEYIDGATIFDLVNDNIDVIEYINEAYRIEKILKGFDLNIDYFPTNFIIRNNKMYYIDYECNKYMDEWNFTNWGIKYWSKTKEFTDYLNSHKKLTQC